MTKDELFAAVKNAVLNCIRSSSNTNVQLTGGTVLGPNIFEDGELKTPGVGMDALLRRDVQLCINAWLRDNGASEALGSAEVGATVTLSDLVNFAFFCFH